MIQMKHQIKMIVSDLDGTLLRSDKSISEPTKAVLQKCRESGIKVVYATGRGGNAECRAPSHLFDGRIIMNGAVARINDTIIYKRLIPYQTARPLLMACDAYGLKAASEVSDMHYSNFVVSDVWSTVTNFKIVDFSKHDVDAEKLYMLIREQNGAALDTALIEKHLGGELYLTVSKDGLWQVMHKEATKSKAIAALAQSWDIDHSEIAAFGDDLNDSDMLEYAGIGVAMENARDEVKAVADSACPGNNEDGVAEWIRNTILI